MSTYQYKVTFSDGIGGANIYETQDYARGIAAGFNEGREDGVIAKVQKREVGEWQDA